MLESHSLSRLLSAMVQATFSEASWPIHRGRELLDLFLPPKTKGSNKCPLPTSLEVRKDCSRAASGAIRLHMLSMVVSTPFSATLQSARLSSSPKLLILALVYNPQPPPSTASPGPTKGRVNRGPPGPATPHQAPSSSYPDPRPSPQLGRPPSPPPQHQGHPVINNLADLDVESLRPEQKREGPDWFAIFNPRIPRVLDVDLVHTLSHDSVVCCVRFSYDGHYVATGCNRSAQIFDVGTGKQVTKLQDESVDKEGDLYIRSVCFSPDGKYLATGAEDKLIRVSGVSQLTTVAD